MKLISRLALSLCLCLAATHMAAAEAFPWLADYNRLLTKYVTPTGVKYAAWKTDAGDMKSLQAVVDGIAQENVGRLERDEQLAFYINAYNAWMLHEALEKYPTRSVKDLLFTFFTSHRIKVAGKQTSFDSLENRTIRTKFNNPKVHFALNCASRSCPPLNPTPLQGRGLNEQLDQLAKDFVNSETGVKVAADGKTAELSEIFEWYKNDFGKGGPLPFINERRAAPIPAGAKISYQKYDWSLNDAK